MGRSFTKIEKRSGPKIEPWGTPTETCLRVIYFQFADAKKTKPLVMMVGPKYRFWSASTHEVRNGIAKKLQGESHI